MPQDELDDDLVEKEIGDETAEEHKEPESEKGAGAVKKRHRTPLEILRDIVGGAKAKHDGHYLVKVSDEHLGEAHDAIAASPKE